jgi:hypothetical protein
MRRKIVPFGRHIKPEVKIDAIHFVRSEYSDKYFICERKNKYKTMKNAEMALKRIKKTGIIVENASIYKCEFCKKFHLGHKKKPS